jgi:hypothetical protein
MEIKYIKVWSTWPLEALQAFTRNAWQVEGCTMGTLEGTNPKAPPINLYVSCFQVILPGFEKFGEQNHHGVEHMALGSSASL